MKTNFKTLVAATLATIGANAQTNWNVDASHSKLGFAVTHMMVSETEGKFKIYEGQVTSVKPDADFTINEHLPESAVELIRKRILNERPIGKYNFRKPT